MNGKNNLLVLSPYIPFPPYGGTKYIVWHEIVYLSNYFDIYLCLIVNKIEIDEFKNNVELQKTYKQFIKKVILLEKKRDDKKSINWVIAKYFSFLPFNIWFNEVKKSELDKLNLFLLENNINIILFQTLFLFNLLVKIKSNCKIVFELHDIQNERYLSICTFQKKIKIKLEYYFEYQKWRYLEKNKLRTIKNFLVFTDSDKKWIENHYKSKNVLIYPVGFPNQAFKNELKRKLSPSTPTKLLFIGSHRYFPNQQAGEYLINNILPKISKNILLKIIGEDWDKMIKRSYESARIIGLEMVPNLIPEYDDSDIIVLPIFSGSGMNIKIVEALATGRPVITTHFAASRFKQEISKYIIIAEKEEEYIFYINKLAKDNDFYRQYSGNREEWVYSNYSYENTISELVDWLDCVL